MNLSELIYRRFAGSGSLAGNLASYAGAPAVFYGEPPDRDQEGWDGNTQYPQALYSFDLQANEERHSAGTLSVSLICQNTADIAPEMIEPAVRDCLRDVILKPEGGEPYCFAWARTDAFTADDQMSIGCDIRFDILEYPAQETTDPDPVMAVNRYVKELYPGCLILGYDRMEETTEASGGRPVIYCSMVSVDKTEETNMVAWMDGRIAIHILCPESGIRIKMAAALANRISLDGEITMLDGSPMFIRRLQANYKSDYLKSGQVFITGHYGVLRYRPKNHTMDGIKYSDKGGYDGESNGKGNDHGGNG